MKILQLIHKIQNRGAETFTCQLSNHLIDLGHDVKLVALYQGEANLPFNEEILVLRANPNNRFFDYKSWKKLSQIISEFQPDIIQANSGDTLKYLVFSKIIFRWKQPIVFRNASEVGRYLKNKYQIILNSFFYKNVEAVISVSEVSKLDIVNNFPFLKNKVTSIPVGLEEKKIKNFALSPAKVKHIIHVGGFSFEKNHEELIEIFASIIIDYKKVHLHLVGDGPLKKSIENLVNKMGLNQNISFYGFVDNPLDYMSSADLLVLPSIIEGLPGVLLEAMYCKTPVVTYNVGGIAEIVNSQTGRIIELGNTDGFVNACLEALQVDNSIQLANAFEMVSKSYLNSSLALKFVNYYQTLVPVNQ